MAISTEYRTYVMERLGSVLPITIKRMFGGAGVYSEELFFAIIDDDVLYFKVDASTRNDYLARNMAQFMTMAYYAVPQDVLDDPELLRDWAEKAVQVAAASKAKSKNRSARGQKKTV